ncbi:MAG: family B DNA polymerase [Eubacterium sp.]|nr:family B DNA polymerase [Eubacterium sp.]
MKLNLDLHAEPIERPKVLDSYRENMITYLATIHPEASREVIQKFVQDFTKQRAQKLWNNLLAAHTDIAKYRELVKTEVIPKMVEERVFKSEADKFDFINATEVQVNELPVGELLRILQNYRVEAPSPKSIWPTVKVVKAVDPNNPRSKKLSYGNLVEFPEVDMLGFSNDYRTKIISPAGSIYETSNNDVAFLTNKIINDKARRSERKKLMLKYRKLGDMAKAKIYNNQQATIKINMNSTSGSMGCNGNFLSSPANYNSITSISRFFIMNAYANSERFLESNFYFRTVEQLLNFLVTCVRLGPDDATVLKACESVSLHLPSADEVEKFLMDNLKQYCFEKDLSPVHKFLVRCTPARLAFIFYMSNFKNVVMTNDTFWRPWMEDILSDANVDYTKQRNPKDIKNVDGDLISVISTA